MQTRHQPTAARHTMRHVQWKGQPQRTHGKQRQVRRAQPCSGEEGTPCPARFSAQGASQRVCQPQCAMREGAPSAPKPIQRKREGRAKAGCLVAPCAQEGGNAAQRPAADRLPRKEQAACCQPQCATREGAPSAPKPIRRKREGQAKAERYARRAHKRGKRCPTACGEPPSTQETGRMLPAPVRHAGGRAIRPKAHPAQTGGTGKS